MDASVGSMVLLLSDIGILCAPFQVSRLVSLAEIEHPIKSCEFLHEAAEDADLRG